MFCDFYIHLQIGFKFRMNECFIYITQIISWVTVNIYHLIYAISSFIIQNNLMHFKMMTFIVFKSFIMPNMKKIMALNTRFAQIYILLMYTVNNGFNARRFRRWNRFCMPNVQKKKLKKWWSHIKSYYKSYHIISFPYLRTIAQFLFLI